MDKETDVIELCTSQPIARNYFLTKNTPFEVAESFGERAGVMKLDLLNVGNGQVEEGMTARCFRVVRHLLEMPEH